MKLTKYHPRNLFRSKKSKSSSVSRTDDPGFGSGSSLASSSSSTNLKEGSSAGTPTSVLPANSPFLLQSKSGVEEELWSVETHFELVEAFKLIDKDGDGKITRSELESVLQRIGGEPPSRDEVMIMFSEIDSDGDGFITLEEFSAISSAFEPPASGSSELRDVFDYFDTDKNGKISAEELLGVFRAIGGDEQRFTLDECKSMISGVDSDGDGFVCFKDFSKMMERQR
ncbi:hypothetical protein C5167_037027 [Papaver somniferum]|uniref:EF-hand domain-containing protein n=1 Tax=Papaver somniferum TaxID=3469 RepID=A0A4Y7I8C6_PAPSO|nr:probable calcium-binding protein CML36 [Papaver somniferum]RZC44080.1 hypothetical protein C5167_037027 [Papaver somniferum]